MRDRFSEAKRRSVHTDGGGEASPAAATNRSFRTGESCRNYREPYARTVGRNLPAGVSTTRGRNTDGRGIVAAVVLTRVSMVTF